jgi:hypothetical protein
MLEKARRAGCVSLVGCSLGLVQAGCGDDVPGFTSTGGGAGGVSGQPAPVGGVSSTGGSPIAGGGTGGGAGSASGAGNVGGGGGASGSSSIPVDCAQAPDACPMPSGVEYACKRRFALGINYAWRSFGADFGGLEAWDIPSVSQSPAGYGSDLEAMKQNGASVIRWWLFPDFRGDGVEFDAADEPTGISARTKADIDKALELAAQNDLYLVPTIFSFDGFRPTTTSDGVKIRSLSGLVSSAGARAKLVAQVVKPLAQAAAQSAHAERLIGWDIINEPEWAIQQTGQGGGQDFSPNPELTAVSMPG